MVAGKTIGIPRPNLGTHTNLKSAYEHYKSIKSHRETLPGYKEYWETCFSRERNGDPRRSCLMGYLEYGKKIREELMIEKWVPKKKDSGPK
jgi:hypothetical protein